MKKYIYSLCGMLMLVLAGCKQDSQRIEIAVPEDQMHLVAPSDTVVLSAREKDQVAVTFTWSWPELQYGATSYDYAFKMDVADNQFATSIPKMAVSGENRLSITHKQLNDWLEGWGIKAGQVATLEAELIATPRGTKEYVKPMLSKAVLNVVGYANILYVLEVGSDYTSARLMEKEAGTDNYLWTGTLGGGEIAMVSEPSATAVTYGKFTIPRAGCYSLNYNLQDNTLRWMEPLFLIGSATEGGWNLGATTPMNIDRYPMVTWTGVLGEGEMKIACHPQSGLFEDAFYKASTANAKPEGTQPIVYDADNSGEDNKWLFTEAGIYTIEVNMTALTISFRRDQSIDDLPVKDVWICGSATPGGWNTPFPEKMKYDFSAPKGTFVWEGSLVAGEIKFPCNADSYEGAFYFADNFDDHVMLDGTHHINYAPSSVGQDDKKWIVDEAGYYRIELNVVENSVKFRKN